jgi:hypothetical protein
LIGVFCTYYASYASEFPSETASAFCPRLNVKDVPNKPIAIIGIENISLFKSFIEDEKCVSNPVNESLINRAVDTAYIIHVLDSVPIDDFIASHVATPDEVKSVSKEAKEQLKQYFKTLKTYTYNANAYDIAVIYHYSCQRSSAMSFDVCPSEFFDVQLKHFRANLPLNSNEIALNFIEEALNK